MKKVDKVEPAYESYGYSPPFFLYLFLSFPIPVISIPYLFLKFPSLFSYYSHRLNSPLFVIINHLLPGLTFQGSMKQASTHASKGKGKGRKPPSAHHGFCFLIHCCYFVDYLFFSFVLFLLFRFIHIWVLHGMHQYIYYPTISFPSSKFE